MPDEAAEFRNSLRVAREACARDAEAFDEVLFVVERLGARLNGKNGDLGKYEECLSILAAKSILVSDSFEQSTTGQPCFAQLFKVVREARNDALHQGSVARQLTARVIELALILEDALVSHLVEVRYLMVRNPTIASKWQTIATVRQLMLANAFSHLPILWNADWKLVSDCALAKFLSESSDKKVEMAKQLDDVIASGALQLIDAPWCFEATSRHEIAQKMVGGVPILVLSECRTYLLGLVAPADVL